MPSAPPPHRPTGRTTAAAAGPASARTVAAAAALDTVAVLAFAAAGRSTHARDGGVLGVLGTAGPFLVAAALGWLLVRAWRAPWRPWPTGAVVWAVAWLGGLTLRAVTGGGTAPAFVVVAGVVLGALLLGWRAGATALTRRRRGRPARAR